MAVPPPMTEDRWTALVNAHADGAFEQQGSGPARQLIFADGTRWFPDGYERESASAAGLPFLGALTLMSLAGAIYGFVRGAWWAWFFVAGLLLIAWAFYLVSRAARREAAALEDRLATGLFLFDDVVVLRDTDFDQSIPRDQITEIRVRGGATHGYLDLVRGEREPVPTDLVAEARPILDAWLRTADPGAD